MYGETGDQARERITRLLTELPVELGSASGFPTEYGGSADVGGSIIASEMLAQVDLSLMVKAGVQWGLFGGAVAALGTQRHHDAYLRDIISGTIFGCFAMTETGHGSDVQQLRTTCTYDPQTQTFDLHTPHEAARKDYIGNAARDGRMAVVFAQLITNGQRHGVHAWLVPIRDAQGNPLPGVTIGDAGPKAGLLGVDNGRLSFDHVQVPRDMLLDRYGQVARGRHVLQPDRERLPALLHHARHPGPRPGERGRRRVGGHQVGADHRGALRRHPPPVRHARTPTGRCCSTTTWPTSASCCPPWPPRTRCTSPRPSWSPRCSEVQGGDGPVDEHRQRELESRAAGLKAAQTWHATRTIQMCREACGGAGYLAENRLPSLKADTDVFTTFEGDNTVLLQLVAKGLLTGYRDEFGSLDGWGRASFVAEQVREMVLERTAARSLIERLISAVPGRDDEVAVTDRGWQLKAFEDRERHLLDGAVRRLRNGAATKKDRPFDIFNDVQDHVLRRRRRAHRPGHPGGVRRRHRDTADPAVRALLSRVCDLYALSVIEANKGWFLEHGRLTPARSKAITGVVNALLKELRPHMRTLVDGFAIPDAWLHCAILREEPAGRRRWPPMTPPAIRR